MHVIFRYKAKDTTTARCLKLLREWHHSWSSRYSHTWLKPTQRLTLSVTIGPRDDLAFTFAKNSANTQRNLNDIDIISTTLWLYCAAPCLCLWYINRRLCLWFVSGLKVLYFNLTRIYILRCVERRTVIILIFKYKIPNCANSFYHYLFRLNVKYSLSSRV